MELPQPLRKIAQRFDGSREGTSYITPDGHLSAKEAARRLRPTDDAYPKNFSLAHILPNVRAMFERRQD